MEKRKTEELIPELYETILRLQTEEDCAAFFSDLCTFKELEQMAQRLAAAKLLLDGKTYVQVIDEVDISSATLSRVSRCIRYSDGYGRVLKSNEE